MKIEYFYQPRTLTLEEFADEYGLVLRVYKWAENHYSANFKDTKIREGNFSSGAWSRGRTIRAAIDAYTKEISGSELVIEGCRVIQVPTLKGNLLMHTVEKSWITKAGLQAAVLFVNDSHRCGYVAVTDENPYFGVDYWEPDIDVHGGLTFSEYGDKEYPVKSEKHLWWFGFDCAHAGDSTKYFSGAGDVMRSLAYVEQECERLAGQLC